MPGTRKEVTIRSGVSSSSVGLWLRTFHRAGEAHIGAWYRSDGGGSFQPVYVAGAGKDARPPVAYTDLENNLRSRIRRRKDGRVEDRNARLRARYYANRAAKKKNDWLGSLREIF